MVTRKNDVSAEPAFFPSSLAPSCDAAGGPSMHRPIGARNKVDMTARQKHTTEQQTSGTFTTSNNTCDTNKKNRRGRRRKRSPTAASWLRTSFGATLCCFGVCLGSSCGTLVWATVLACGFGCFGSGFVAPIVVFCHCFGFGLGYCVP